MPFKADSLMQSPQKTLYSALKIHARQSLVAVLCFQLAFSPVIAQAENFKLQGGGDHAPNNGRPFVDGAQNGVPLININTPNSKGLSHNTYNDFNVSERGLILNNNATNVLTKQAGWIEGNPNLRTASEASLILNEVVGATRSQLNGYLEVAGKRADVIVANPNGITCKGCGFINTDRGVLSTGNAQFNDDGSLQAMRVTGGDINIQGTGLDGSSQQRIDLLAHAVKIQGKVRSQGQLNIATGNNSIDYAGGAVTKLADSQGDDAPTVGLDVSSLGGMYANSISLRITDKGAGVNMQGGELIAIGQINLNADGDITLAGTRLEAESSSINVTADNVRVKNDDNGNASRWLSKEDITVTSKTLTHISGANIASDKDITMAQFSTGQGDILISNSQIEAKRNLALNGQKIDTANKAVLLSGKYLTLRGEDIKLVDSVLSSQLTLADNDSGYVTISANNLFEIAGGSINAAHSLKIKAPNITINNAQLAALQHISLQDINSTPSQSQKSQKIAMTNSKVIAAAGDLKLFSESITIDGDYVTDENGEIIRDIDDNATPITQLWAGNDIAIQVGTFHNSTGLLWAAKDLFIDADGNGGRATSIINNQGSLVAAKGDVTLSADLVENQGLKPTFVKDGYAKNWTDTAGSSPTDVIGDTYKLIDSQFLEGGVIKESYQAAYIDLLYSLATDSNLSDAAKGILKSTVIDGNKVTEALTNSWKLMGANATQQNIASIDSYLKTLLAGKVTKTVTVTDPDTGADTELDQEINVLSGGDINPLLLAQYIDLWEAVIKGETLSSDSLALIDPDNKEADALNADILAKFTAMSASSSVPYDIKYFLTADKLNKDGHLGRIIAGGDININTATFNNIHAHLAAGNDINIAADTAVTNKAFAASQVVLEVHKKGCYTCHEGVQGYGDSFGGKMQAKNNFLLTGVIDKFSSTVEATDDSQNAVKLTGLVTAANQDTGSGRSHVDETHDHRTSDGAAITAKEANVASLKTTQDAISDADREASVSTLSETATPLNLVTADGIKVSLPISLIANIEDLIDTGDVPLTDALDYPRELRLNYADYLSFLSSAFSAGRLGNHRELRDAAFGDGFPSPGQLQDGYNNSIGDGWSGPNTAVANENALNRASWLIKTERAIAQVKQQIETASFISDALQVAMAQGGIDQASYLADSSRIYGEGSNSAVHSGGALIAANQIDINVNGDVVLQGQVSADQRLALNSSLANIDSQAQLSAVDAQLNAQNIRQRGGSIQAQNATFKAAQDIEITAAAITIKENLNLTAERDINIGSQLNKSTGIRAGRRWNSEKRIASEIAAGGSLQLNTGRDINITGSSVSADKAILASAGRDLDLLSETEKRDYSYRQSSKVLNPKQSRYAQDTVTLTQTDIQANALAQAAATLKSGGDIDIDTGRDVNLQASNLVSNGDINVDSQGAINIASALSTRNSTTRTAQETIAVTASGQPLRQNRRSARDSAMGATTQLTENSQTQSASLIDARGSINLTSGTDTRIRASKLSAGNDINIAATGDIQLQAGIDKLNSHTQQNAGTDSTGNSNSSQQNIAAISELNAIGDITLSSGNDIEIEAAALAAIGKLEVTAAGGVNVKAVAQQHNQQSQSSSRYTQRWENNDESYTRTISNTQSISKTSSDYKGARLSGDGVVVSAGGDLTAQAASIESAADVALQAKNINLLSLSANNSSSTSNIGNSRGNTRVSRSNTTQQKSAITAQGDIIVQAEKEIDVLSSYLSAKENLNLAAGENILVRSTIESSNYNTSEKNRFSNKTTQSSSVLNAGQNINIQSQQNIGVIGSEVTAQENLQLRARENLVLASAEEFKTSGYSYSKSSGFLGHRKKTVSHNEQYLTHKRTVLTAGEEVALVSGADTQVIASDVISKNADINISAAGELQVKAELDKSRVQHSTKKGSFWGLVKKDHSIDTVKHSANGSISDAMGNVALQSGGSTRLQASELSAGGTVKILAGKDAQGNIINPNAKIYFDSITEFESIRESIFDSSGLKYISIDKGHEKTSEVQTVINSEDTDIQAANGIQVQLGVGSDGSLDQTMEQLVAQPGMEWLASLKQQGDIDWVAVETHYKDWHYEQTGVSALASLIIAIAVGAALGPLGGGFIGGAGGQGAAAAIGGGSLGTAAAGALSVAIEAGVLSLATTASIRLINNNGDIGGVFKDLGSSSNVKSLITSMLTAGIANKALQSINISAVTDPTSFKQVAIQSFKTNIVSNSIRATLSTAIEGGDLSDNLKQALRASVASALGEAAANEIGESYLKARKEGGNNPLKYASHKIAHAALGCATGQIGSGDCESGALGGLVGAITAEAYDQQRDEFVEDLNELYKGEGKDQELVQAKVRKWTEMGVDVSKVAAGLVAAAAGKDVDVAANAGGNAAEHNILPFIVVAAKVGLAVYTAYELKESAEKAYALYKRIEAGEDFTPQELKSLALELGIEVGASVILSKLKVLEAAAELAEKSGLTGKARKIQEYVDNIGAEGTSANRFDDIAIEGQIRQEELLESNQGFNVSGARDEINYPDGALGNPNPPNGPDEGFTFLTDQQAFENVLGTLPQNGSTIRVTRDQINQLEDNLGLIPGSLDSGSTLRLFDEIDKLSPSSPLDGNDLFRGPGMHLPDGSPEIVLNPAQVRTDNPNIKGSWKIEVIE